MGSTLPMIITFNLALAYHLTAIVEEGPNNRDLLQKVLQLYELAYRWQLEDQGNEQVNSLSFTMILANNFGESIKQWEIILNMPCACSIC
jgi:hypothetical protein